MAGKKTSKGTIASNSAKNGRDARRMRSMNLIFLVICAIVIFSMIAMAVAK